MPAENTAWKLKKKINKKRETRSTKHLKKMKNNLIKNNTNNLIKNKEE